MGTCLIYVLKLGSRLQSNGKFVAQDKVWTISGPIPGRHQSSGSPMLYIGYWGMTLFYVPLIFDYCQYVFVSHVCIYSNTTPNLCMTWLYACMHVTVYVCKHVALSTPVTFCLYEHVLTGWSNIHVIMIFTL